MRVYIEEQPWLKVTRVYAFDDFGNKVTIANFYWLVHGRQGAWQQAHVKYKISKDKEDA